MLKHFKKMTDPVLSAVELEEDLGEEWEMGEEGIRQRLNELVAKGELETKKPGSTTRVYWLSSGSDSA